MRALAIDTTRKILVIALIDGDKMYTKIINESNKKHNSILLPEIEQLLDENNLKINDIDYFGAVTGPGSFTGIRIGVATVNALSNALKKPLVNVNSFELIAYNVKESGVCLIDALHGNFYGADVDSGKVTNLSFYEADALPKCQKFYQDKTADYADALANVVSKKIINGETQTRLMPLYLRKSQAEREADNV